ncbi:hypothetical protein FSP39_002737 [Pinctada imbricata]|uniref:Uncharacterized protein n=1 Tax=Pinctada imbricata TaxID=66713 RepID=A0AA88XM77_PINIB|nr:hypothetical protein FSP39_002737 [Pinctada imbricata]
MNPVRHTEHLNNVSSKYDIHVENKAILTLFTTWISTPEKYDCHNNTLFNWNSLKPLVQPVLFTNDIASKNEALQKGWQVLPLGVTRTKYEVPVLRYMYMDVMKISSSPLLAYANGDILFTSNLIVTLQSLLNDIKTNNISQTNPLLMIGQRTNVKSVALEEIQTSYKMHLMAKTRGKLFSAWGEDYFITSRNYPWKTFPDVIIGRLAYDNWMVWNAKRLKFTTIDATKTLLAVHQTTKSGNMEGHHKPDNRYNTNLLRKTYKKLKYVAGLTICADYYSQYGSKSVLFLKRKLHRRCIP